MTPEKRSEAVAHATKMLTRYDGLRAINEEAQVALYRDGHNYPFACVSLDALVALARRGAEQSEELETYRELMQCFKKCIRHRPSAVDAAEYAFANEADTLAFEAAMQRCARLYDKSETTPSPAPVEKVTTVPGEYLEKLEAMCEALRGIPVSLSWDERHGYCVLLPADDGRDNREIQKVIESALDAYVAAHPAPPAKTPEQELVAFVRACANGDYPGRGEACEILSRYHTAQATKTDESSSAEDSETPYRTVDTGTEVHLKRGDKVLCRMGAISYRDAEDMTAELADQLGMAWEIAAALPTEAL